MTRGNFNSHRRGIIRARWRSIAAPCALCGEPIDYDLPYYIPDPMTGRRTVNPYAFVVDEILPVSRGGDPLDFSNTQPAHFICNARKGNKVYTKPLHDIEQSNNECALPQPWDWSA